MAGDTGHCVNPGPCKFPCGICSKCVKDNQAGIECENCFQWYHKQCIHQSTKSYEAFQKNSGLTWICASCLFPNYSSSWFSSLLDFTSENDFSALLNVTDTILLSPVRLQKTSTPVKTPPAKPDSRRRKLTLLCANINGIKGKKLELQSFLELENPEVVALQETKINENILDNELFPSELGYTIFRKDRIMGGGGVLLAIKSYLDPLQCRIDTSGSESVWAKIQLEGQAHYFCTYYRPPDQHFSNLSALREQLTDVSKLHPTEKQPAIHIMGDFNFRCVDWETVSNRNGGELSDSEGLVLVDILRDFYLEQLITFPTREDKTLDLLMTNRPGLVSDIRSPAKFSDHDAISCMLSCATSVQRKTRRKVYLYAKADFEEIRKDMSHYNDTFLKSSMSNSVEEDWSAFKNSLSGSIEKNIPSKFVSGRDKLPWLSPFLRRLIRRKSRLHVKFKKTGSARLRRKWHMVRRQLSKYLREARNDYINGVIGDVKSNPKPFWKFIASQRKDSQSMPPLRKEQGHLAESDDEKASTLNQQFCDSFSSESSTSIPFLRRKFPVMPDIKITENGVFKLLSNLKPSKAAGPDGLHPLVLKQLAPVISPTLALIFQKSLDNGSLPNDWRDANICPLFKKGDRSLAINYRPVSLTSIVCKTLEHIVASNIMAHIENNNILSDRQHAFRKSHSCTTQLCHVINDWAFNIDRGYQTDAFVIDFAKAFDKVPHERLKSKLFSYGISRSTLLWIDAFLYHRRQRVVVNGSTSEWANVTSGVPQGTVLGPLLFNLFINDIVEVVSAGTEIRLFADDCICYRRVSSSEDNSILQHDIDRLSEWADMWCMDFAPSKCKTMRVSTKTKHNIQYLYHLKGMALESVKELKYLGVTITYNLRWNKHVADMTSKANKILGLLRRNLYFCDRNTKEAAYIGLVRPIIEYASAIWDPHTQKLTLELEKIQRRAVRFVTSDYHNYEEGAITSHLSNLGWDALKDRREAATLALFKQGINNQANIPVSHLTQPKRISRHMHTMHFDIPFARTDTYKFSFLPRAIRIWNNLPRSFVNSTFTK